MINVKDSVMFSEENYSVMLEIVGISKDGTHLLITDEKGILLENTIYNISSIRAGGMLSGTGAVVKTRRPKSPRAAKNENLVEYVIKILRPFEMLQFRSTYRFNCYFPAAFEVYENNNFSSPQSHWAHVTNISTGGAKVTSDVQSNKNDVCNIRARLLSEDVELLAVIIDSEPFVSADRLYKFVTRVRFTHVTEHDEEAISKYIFELFRQERRKQLHRKEAAKAAANAEEPADGTENTHK